MEFRTTREAEARIAVLEHEAHRMHNEGRLAASCGEFDLHDAHEDNAAHRHAEAARIRALLPTLEE